MLNHNLRFLRIKPEGFYMKNGLCDSCANKHSCSLQTVRVQLCTDYTPVLAFKSLAGTEAEFNTFRLGGAWRARTQPGAVIGLLNHKSELVGRAAVQAVHCGPRQLMIEEHAHRNHLMIAAAPQDPVAELTRKLRNLYGINYLNRAELITVLDLNRLD